MADMINTAIAFTFSNFTLAFFVIGLIFSAIAMVGSTPITAAVAVEKLLGWYVFFTVGVSYLCNFIGHVFFGRETAAFIGWADSPFQFEVGTASLGFAVVGFLAAWQSFDLRLAAVIGPGIFTLGAAVGHVQQMIASHNFAPGNAGVIFYTDIAIPLVGFVLLWLQWRVNREPTRAIPA